MDKSQQVEQVAKVCHETLRAFCQSLDDHSMLPWEEAPEWQKESSRAGVRSYFKKFADGIEPSPEETHVRWLEERQANGWKHGETKNHQTKEHPALVPYQNLSLDEKRKDYLFAAICRAFCESAAAEASSAKAKK